LHVKTSGSNYSPAPSRIKAPTKRPPPLLPHPASLPSLAHTTSPPPAIHTPSAPANPIRLHNCQRFNCGILRLPPQLPPLSANQISGGRIGGPSTFPPKFHPKAVSIPTPPGNSPLHTGFFISPRPNTIAAGPRFFFSSGPSFVAVSRPKILDHPSRNLAATFPTGFGQGLRPPIPPKFVRPRPTVGGPPLVHNMLTLTSSREVPRMFRPPHPQSQAQRAPFSPGELIADLLLPSLVPALRASVVPLNASAFLGLSTKPLLENGFIKIQDVRMPANFPPRPPVNETPVSH